MAVKGRFKKGESGNPNGRPKGSTGKWNEDKVLEYLQRGNRDALETIRQLMTNESEKSATRLKAAISWLSEHARLSEEIKNEVKRKIEEDHARIKKEKDNLALKEMKEKFSDEKSNKKDSAPVFSLVAIDK